MRLNPPKKPMRPTLVAAFVALDKNTDEVTYILSFGKKGLPQVDFAVTKEAAIDLAKAILSAADTSSAELRAKAKMGADFKGKDIGEDHECADPENCPVHRKGGLKDVLEGKDNPLDGLIGLLETLLGKEAA